MDSQTLCVLHHRTKCAALKGELCLLIHFRELFSNIMRKHCLLSCHKMLTFNISAKCSVSTLLIYFPTTAAHKKMTDNFFQLNLDIHSACVAETGLKHDVSVSLFALSRHERYICVSMKVRRSCPM